MILVGVDLYAVPMNWCDAPILKHIINPMSKAYICDNSMALTLTPSDNRHGLRSRQFDMNENFVNPLFKRWSKLIS